MKKIILDLFCGQGGAAVGYHLAGFTVVGVDLNPANLKRYPFAGHCGDVITVLDTLLAGGYITLDDGTSFSLDEVVAIHASPPCQGYSIATAGNPVARAKYLNLIAPTRARLELTGLPYIIENVEQAKAHMVNPVLLCGRQFGLTATDADGTPLVLDRHRLFETNWGLTAPAHPQHDLKLQVAGVYGGSRRAKRLPNETLAQVAPRDRHAARVERGGGYVPRSHDVQRELLGITWMTIKGMQESIPPAYSHWIGEKLQKVLAE